MILREVWTLGRSSLRFAGGLLLAGTLLLAAGGAMAQTRTTPEPPKQLPPPSPERVYPGAIDRPLAPPDILRDDRVDPDAGVKIGLGPTSVALHFPDLKVDDAPTLNPSEGVAISADVQFGFYRLGYTHQFYRRVLPTGTKLDGKPVNFLAIDSDFFLGTLGFRPIHQLFLGGLAGLEYRLVRVKQDAENVHTVTETTGVIGGLAEWQVAAQFSVQVRVLRETTARLVRLDSTILQLNYLIPF